MNRESPEHLETVVRAQQAASTTLEKWWNRAPIIWTMAVVLGAGIFSLGVWSATLQGRIGKLEEGMWSLQHDNNVGVLEQVHNASKDTKRNRAQIRTLNQVMFKVPDTGTDE